MMNVSEIKKIADWVHEQQEKFIKEELDRRYPLNRKILEGKTNEQLLAELGIKIGAD